MFNKTVVYPGASVPLLGQHITLQSSDLRPLLFLPLISQTHVLFLLEHSTIESSLAQWKILFPGG